MISLAVYTLTIVSLILAVPVLVLAIEVFASLFPRPSHGPDRNGPTRPSVAILVPAHNESTHLLPTLRDIEQQTLQVDRVLVVADNCSDDTARVAASAGAEVIERNEPDRRGKGFALDWGVRHLAKSPPEVVIIIDADCRLGPDAIERLACAAASAGRPMQAQYLMKPGVEHGPGASAQRIAAFAILVKNLVRPLGLLRMGLPCHLFGTGMAFPWSVIAGEELATDNLVEDVKLGLDLAKRGHAPRFCPSACVESTFPASDKGQITQRQRWEHGSLRLLATAGPRLLVRSILKRNLNLAALALDLMVPPIVLLMTLLFGFLVVSFGAAVSGFGSTALYVSSACVLLTLFSIALAWWRHGREVIAPSDAMGGRRVRRTKDLCTSAKQLSSTARVDTHR